MEWQELVNHGINVILILGIVKIVGALIITLIIASK